MTLHTIDRDALRSAGRDATEARARLRAIAEYLGRRIQERAAQVHETYDVTMLDVGAMLDQLQGAVAHNAEVQRVREQRQKQDDTLTKYKAEMTLITQDIAEFTARFAEIETEYHSLSYVRQRAEPVQEIDPALLRLAIDDAMGENARKYDERRARRLYREAISDLDRVVREIEQLTAIVDEAARSAVEQDAEAEDVAPVGA